MNIWHCYKIGFRVNSLQNEKKKPDKSAYKYLLYKVYDFLRCFFPIDYVRWREFAFVFEAVKKYLPNPQRVLDISSPKLVPLTLAKELPDAAIYAIDILDSEVNYVENTLKHLSIDNVIAEKQDCRQLNFPDGSFDLVTSVSVFEHIAPEVGGEIPASRELSRVLAPGGLAILTVPFSRKYFAEYRQGAVYERQGGGGEFLFFQRFYDLDLLMTNIVEASGLELVSLDFIEERFFFQDPHKRLAHYVDHTPYQRIVFGPWFPILAHLFLSPPKPLEKCRKPYLACLVLKKL